MKNVARGLVALIAILYIFIGLRFIFTPDGAMVTAGLEAVGVGVANVRAYMGGPFLAFGILLMMHTVINQETGALRFVILAMLISIIARILDLIVGGMDPSDIRGLLFTIVLFGTSVFSLVTMLKDQKA